MKNFLFSPPSLYSRLDVKGTYTHSSSCNNAQILSQKLWHKFKEGGERKKKESRFCNIIAESKHSAGADL